MEKEQEEYQQKLESLVQKGYEIFSLYQPNPEEKLDACICNNCLSESEHQYLINNSLQNIEFRVFKHYVNAAYSEGKTPLNEFKYFLVLFLDFFVQGRDEWISEVYFFDRVKSYSRTDWTKQELEFLQEFAENYITHELLDENNAELNSIANYLDTFSSYLFDTEKLAELCISHPSAYCLIDYATHIVNGGYDDEERVEGEKLCSKRVGAILINWKYSHYIKKLFVDRYYEFKAKGHAFDYGNANWVHEWIKEIEANL